MDKKKTGSSLENLNSFSVEEANSQSAFFSQFNSVTPTLYVRVTEAQNQGASSGVGFL